jgi:hypothetical protein
MRVSTSTLLGTHCSWLDVDMVSRLFGIHLPPQLIMMCTGYIYCSATRLIKVEARQRMLSTDHGDQFLQAEFQRETPLSSDWRWFPFALVCPPSMAGMLPSPAPS